VQADSCCYAICSKTLTGFYHACHITTLCTYRVPVQDDGDPSRSIVPMISKILNVVLTAIRRIYSSLWVAKKNPKQNKIDEMLG